MSLSQDEFEAIIQDASKTIQGDIAWQQHPQHELLARFKAVVEDGGYALSVRGTYNLLTLALSYHLILPPYGRIYGLDLGKDHRNPDGQFVGDKHKHRWTELYRDKQAYVPPDITASQEEPILVWRQFCREACIQHDGVMTELPSVQGDLFL